jgi:hypothetical protein
VCNQGALQEQLFQSLKTAKERGKVLTEGSVIITELGFSAARAAALRGMNEVRR